MVISEGKTMNSPFYIPKSKLQSLLDKINGGPHTSYDLLVHQEEQRNKPFEPEAPPPLSADDWGRFKYRFMETYRGEKVESTGMTHSEFLQYIATGGYREGTEFEDPEWFWNYEHHKSHK